jgi:thiol:disulfide interchange protein DsbA
MNKIAALLLVVCGVVSIGGCNKAQTPPATTPPPAAPAAAEVTVPTAAPAAPVEETPVADTSVVESETISETDDEPTAAVAEINSAAQPSLRLGGPPSTAPTSAKFKQGTHYQVLIPAQPTSAGPGKVEVVEVFWYGCGHCFALDSSIESWRAKDKPSYVEFLRVPAMWNDTVRMHARVFYTAELLGKLEQFHTLIFREIHTNGDMLNTVDKISAFFKKNGVSNEEFQKAFSSFAVESKLQRADFLNRRYKVESVPVVIVNGKYKADVSGAGGEPQLFSLINELAAHEHGG